MNKVVEITVKRQSGTFPLVVSVGEDGKFYKVKKVTLGTVRHTLVAGIFKDGKVAFGVRYYAGDLSHDDGQELYLGKIGGVCEAMLNMAAYIYDREVEIKVEEDVQYVPQDGEIMSYDETDLQERSYLDGIMQAVKHAFGHIT